MRKKLSVVSYLWITVESRSEIWNVYVKNLLKDKEVVKWEIKLSDKNDASHKPADELKFFYLLFGYALSTF